MTLIRLLTVLAWSSAETDEIWEEKDDMRKHRMGEDEQTKGNFGNSEGVNRKRWRTGEDDEQ